MEKGEQYPIKLEDYVSTMAIQQKNINILTDSVVVRRVPSVHNSWVHQPNISIGLLSQADQILLAVPVLHVQNIFCMLGSIGRLSITITSTAHAK